MLSCLCVRIGSLCRYLFRDLFTLLLNSTASLILIISESFVNICSFRMSISVFNCFLITCVMILTRVFDSSDKESNEVFNSCSLHSSLPAHSSVDTYWAFCNLFPAALHLLTITVGITTPAGQLQYT